MTLMKRKALTLVLIFALLISAVVVTQLVNLGRANPYIYLGVVPPDSNTKPPEISILSPENNTILGNNHLFLNFTISVGASTTGSYMSIYNAGYKADWKSHDQWVNPKLTEFSFNLTDIPDGNHSITVHAAEEGSYIPAHDNSNPMTRNDFYVNGSSSVFFIVDTAPPRVSVLSLENMTYDPSNVPLNFTTSEMTPQISYVLDGQENVTISGNTTLTGLPVGSHNITIYAWDTAGNAGSSETITFNVDEETSVVAPVAAASAATIATVGVVFLIYFKKRKR
jgi:predicted phage tail protein